MGETTNRRPSPQAAATPTELPKMRTYSKLQCPNPQQDRTPATWGGFGGGASPHKQQQLGRSCVSPAQGCGHSTLPWVSAPTNIATL